jgi:hypothetical protein
MRFAAIDKKALKVTLFFSAVCTFLFRSVFYYYVSHNNFATEYASTPPRLEWVMQPGLVQLNPCEISQGAAHGLGKKS